MTLSALKLRAQERGADNFKESADAIPLVVVEGFLSWTAGSTLLWGKFETYLNAHRTRSKRRKVIFSSVGPVSSLHDRACELYYAVKGGTVDYGEAHSRIHGHRQFGRHHSTGLYPHWSSQHPVHFIGHSMGGATITTLMTLLRSGFFGRNSHPDMVASVTTLSSPFRGTQFVYDLGGNLDSSPGIRQPSVGSFLAKGLHAIAYASPFLRTRLLPDLHAESREMTFAEMSFSTLLKQMGRSEWAESKDVTPWDVTFETAEENSHLFWLNAHRSTSRTWFRSYAASMTKRESLETPFHIPNIEELVPAAALYFSAKSMGRFNFSSISPAPAFLSSFTYPRQPSTRYFTPPASPHLSPRRSSTLVLLPDSDDEDATESEAEFKPSSNKFNASDVLSEEYYSNDGVVPLFSQWHPGECSPLRCVHHSTERSPPPSPRIRMTSLDDFVPINEAPESEPEPGIFQVYHIPGSTNHLSVMPVWFGTKKQKRFWEDVGVWLDLVDQMRSKTGDS